MDALEIAILSLALLAVLENSFLLDNTLVEILHQELRTTY